LIVQQLHVCHLIEGDDISLQPLEDRAGLLGRAGMRLIDGDVGAGVGLVFGVKGLVDVRIEFARHVIGDIEDVGRPFSVGRAEPKDRGGGGDGKRLRHGRPLKCAACLLTLAYRIEFAVAR
jgi:hypothetical protein